MSFLLVPLVALGRTSVQLFGFSEKYQKCDWEERWDKQIDSIKVAAKINDLWGEEAEKLCQKILICSPVSMTLLLNDFPTTIGLTDTMLTCTITLHTKYFGTFRLRKRLLLISQTLNCCQNFEPSPKNKKKTLWRNVNASKGINVPMESRVVVGIYIFSPLYRTSGSSTWGQHCDGFR